MSQKKSNFFEDVYEVVKQIPSGRVTSYGSIAQYLGLKSSARMVGWALNKSNIEKEIPAHRVVNRNGRLTGKIHFNGASMEELLTKEGIIVFDDQIIDFEKIFWDPRIELEIK